MFSFLALANRMAAEKEMHVAGAMRSIGLAESAWWISYWVPACGSAVLVSLLVYLVGLGFGIQLFVNIDGLLAVLIFALFMLAMTAFAFFLCSLTHRVRSASAAAVCVLLLGAVFGALSREPDTNAMAYMWWEEVRHSVSRTADLWMMAQPRPRMPCFGPPMAHKIDTPAGLPVGGHPHPRIAAAAHEPHQVAV
eukprot:2226474-Prymnesium_polylepis.1